MGTSEIQENLEPRRERVRQIIRSELIARCQKNPRYSLRAFAKSIGVEAPTLSHVLNGKRTLPQAKLRKVLECLGFNCDEVLGAHTKGDSHQRPGLPDDKYLQLSIDNFKLMGEWHHFAILELIRIPTFRPERRNVARALGLSLAEVADAIERLLRLGYLEVCPKKVLRTTATHTTTTGNVFSNEALRKLQRMYLEKAIVALDAVPFERRDNSGVTMTVALKDLKKIKEEIKKFRRELTELAEANSKPDEVYQLAVAFFPLSNLKEDKNV